MRGHRLPVLALTALVLSPAFSAEAKYRCSLSCQFLQPAIQQESRPFQARADTELLGWRWLKPSPPTSDPMEASSPGSGTLVGSATQLGFVLPDGTKITANERPPGEYECLMRLDGAVTKLVGLARQGTTIPTAQIDLCAAGGKQGHIISFKLSGVRVRNITVWAPGFGPRQGLLGLPDDQPLAAVTLSATHTELHVGEPK